LSDAAVGLCDKTCYTDVEHSIDLFYCFAYKISRKNADSVYLVFYLISPDEFQNIVPRNNEL